MFEVRGKWHRYVSLGILIYILYLGFILLIYPALQASSMAKEEYLSVLEQLNRYQKIASTFQAEQSNNKVLNEAINSQNSMIKASDMKEAQRMLQQLILSAAKQANANIGRSVPLTVKEKSDQHVYIQVQLSVNHAGLSKLLFLLENKQPIVFVDEINIEARNQYANLTIQQETSLNVTLNCFALWSKIQEEKSE